MQAHGLWNHCGCRCQHVRTTDGCGQEISRPFLWTRRRVRQRLLSQIGMRRHQRHHRRKLRHTRSMRYRWNRHEVLAHSGLQVMDIDHFLLVDRLNASSHRNPEVTRYIERSNSLLSFVPYQHHTNCNRKRFQSHDFIQKQSL